MHRIFWVVFLFGCPSDRPAEEPIEVLDAALPDAALPDAALPDAMLDAALPDAALPDAALPDAALPDAALPDAAEPDAALPDAAPPDAGPLFPEPGPLPPPPPAACALSLGTLEAGALDQRHLRARADRVAWLRADGSLVRWTVEGGPQVVELDGRQRDQQFSADGRFLVVRAGNRTGTLTGVDFETGARQALPHGALGGYESPDGSVVLGLGGAGAFVADLAQGSLALVAEVPACSHPDCELPLRAADGALYWGFRRLAGGVTELDAWFEGVLQPPIRLDRLIVSPSKTAVFGVQPDSPNESSVVHLEAGQVRRLGSVPAQEVENILPSRQGSKLLVIEGENVLRIHDVASGEVEEIEDLLPYSARWHGDDYLAVQLYRDFQGEDPRTRIIRPGHPGPGHLVESENVTWGLPGPGRLSWTSIGDRPEPGGYPVHAYWFGEVFESQAALLPLPSPPIFLIADRPTLAFGMMNDLRIFLADLTSGAVAIVGQGVPDLLDLTGERAMWLQGGVLRTARMGEPVIEHSHGVTEWVSVQRAACRSLVFLRCTDGAPCDAAPGVFHLDW